MTQQNKYQVTTHTKKHPDHTCIVLACDEWIEFLKSKDIDARLNKVI